MSTDIPFGAHPSTGAPPPSLAQASSYFGPPSGSSPTDANPFHFVATPSSGLNQASQQQPPPLTAVPSNFFHQSSNPNMNIFNPGAPAGGDNTNQLQQQNFISDAFGVPSVGQPSTLPPHHVSQQYPPSVTPGLPHHDTADLDTQSVTAHQMQSHMSVPWGFTDGGQNAPPNTAAAGVNEDGSLQAGYQRHSSAPTLPAVAGLFSAPPGAGQSGQTSGDFFSSFAPNQLNSLPSSNVQSDFQSRTPAALPRPYSQEPPSPGGHRPEDVASSGSLSAPSTTVHQVLSHNFDHRQEATSHSQHVVDKTGRAESSSLPITPPYRPPSNADTADHSGTHVYPMTNADIAGSNNVPVPVVPVSIRPSQVHPSLTEDLGITNASHGSQANLRTNAGSVVDIRTAIDEATSAADDVASPVEVVQSLSAGSQEDGSGQEGKSLLNLDSSLNKSVSSLLDGSQEDFSSYSPIRLLPPAPGPKEGEDPLQSQPTLEQYTTADNAHLKAAPPMIGTAASEVTESKPYSTEHGHEKKASDDLKDWEIVDSIPPASDLSLLPSSVKLLPPSSFTSVPSESVTMSGMNPNVPTDAISSAVQQLSLEPPSQAMGGVQQQPIPPTVHGHKLASATVPASTGPPHSLPVNTIQTGNDKESPVSHINTNITNLQAAPPTHYPSSSHSESRLSANLPEPKDISSLITQIPFLTPTGTSQPSTSFQPAISAISTALSSHEVSTVQPSRQHQGGLQLQGGVSQLQVHPPVTAPLHVAQTDQASLTGTNVGAVKLQTGPATNMEPPKISAPSSTLPSSLVSAQPVSVAATSAFDVPQSGRGQLPQPSSTAPSAVPVTAAQQYAQKPTHQAPQPQTTSAFVHVQPQHQLKESVVQERPELNPQGHLPSHTITHPAPISSSVAPSLSTEIAGHTSQQAGVCATLPPVESTQMTQTQATTHPSVNPPLSLSSSSTLAAALPSVEPHQHQPQQQAASSAPSTTSSQNTTRASSQHHEDRRESFEQSHPHRYDDHGYYHDSYYDHERESYYGGDQYRAPSAFSEREAEHYHRGYHPRPDSRPRNDYSHYPSHPADAGYHYRPGYHYDDPYHRGGYPPPLYGPQGRSAMRDEYGMPIRPPYHDPYDPYGYHSRYRYGGHYPPPPGHYYGMEYPPSDPLYDYHHPPSDYEHDPRLHPESGYDSHGYPHQQQEYGVHEELNPAEASAIGGQMDNFEVSQFVDSPNVRLPGRPHPRDLQHNSTAYLDPRQQEYTAEQQRQEEMAYPSSQVEGGHYHGEQEYHQQEQGYAEGSWYYPHDTHHDAQGSYPTAPYYSDQGPDFSVPAEPPVDSTPPPPPRETPELFAHPHVRATFGFGGQLVTVVPSYPGVGHSPTVEIAFLKDVASDDETTSLVEAVEGSLGPFIPGDTPKSHVVRFASREAQKCREKISKVEGDLDVCKKLEDEALLWEFLVLLCQQNGVVVSSDISELLLGDSSVSGGKPVAPLPGATATQEGSLDALRQLLFAGRKKDAVDMACSRGLWGHALMLASRMDEQTRTYVVNRFTASLMNTDPLSTFYTLLLGRTPSAVKVEGLPRAGDWKPHLAMILANRISKLENASIVSLGDSLLSQSRLHAAHLCYHLANVHFSAYGSTDSKYSLLGTDHTQLIAGSYPQPSDLHMMEVLEFAMSLSKQDFIMPNFQLFKFLHAIKLLELGFVSKALKYCEQISCAAIVKSPHCFAPVFLHILLETSVRLHHLCTPFDLVESELPSWLHQLQQVVTDALSTDYAPSLFSPSPAFSSVSQSYGGQQPTQQPIIGLQANTTAGGYLHVPGTVGSSRVESGASSKEGSVINMKIDFTGAHPAMRGAPPLLLPPTSNGDVDGSTQTAEPLAEQQQQQQQQQQHLGLMQTAGQTYDASQYQSQYDPSLSTTTSQHQQLYSSTDGQPHPPAQTQEQGQFPVGVGDTGYGQYGASAEGQTVPVLDPGLQQEPGVAGSGNMAVFPGGYAQAQVSQAQQIYYGDGTQPMSQGVMMSQGYGSAGLGAESRVQQEVAGVDGASAGGEHGHTGQVAYDNYYGPPSTSQHQPSSEHHSPPSQPSQPPPTQVGYPSQTDYGYGQWEQPAKSHDSGELSEDIHRKRQQELESSSRTEAESVGSADSHVTEKKEGDGKGEKKKDQKTGKGEQQRQVKGGSGWGFGFMKYILPKKKNEAHLPDDKNPSIIWDEEKKQWIDLTADPEELSGPPPPPTDAQLSQTKPAASAPPPSIGGSGPTPHMMSSTRPGLSGGAGVEGTDQGQAPAAKSTYSMQKSRRGLRSKYVDVLNPGGSKPSSGGPPPPGPPLMGAMMPGPPQPFSGTFFVPQQPPVDSDQGGSGNATETPPSSSTTTTSEAHTNVNTTSESRTRASTTESIGVSQHGAPSDVAGRLPQATVQPVDTPTPFQGQPPDQHHVNAWQDQSHQTQQNAPQPFHGEAQRDTKSDGPTPTPQFPQFFNPSAFATVNAFPPSLPGSSTAEPQDDAMSTVSLISESSQEVSQYMNKQAPSTSSAGYNRLKHGIRGVRPYPSMPGGGVQQQRPHPSHAPMAAASGPPPHRNIYQPMQPMQ